MITLENILELPDPEGFVSKQIPVSLDEIMRSCKAWLPVWNAVPGAEEARWREKIFVEFIL
jgi:hypothetical protein